MNYLKFFLFLLFGLELVAFAKGKTLTDPSQSIYVGINFHFADSAADHVLGATYRQKMTNPTQVVAGLGFRLFGFFYLGARYEYWMTSRDFTSNNIDQKDTLKYQTIGGEFGIYRGNPRFFWTVTAGVFYPLTINVDSIRAGTSMTFSHIQKPTSYQARLTLGLKLGNRVSLRFEGGYRQENLGNMVSGASPLIANGEVLNLSGPFAGVGLGFHF